MIFKNVNIIKNVHLGILQINRKDFNNALSIDISYEIIEGLKQLEKDKNIKCIAIIGNETFFSPGADIKELNILNNYSTMQIEDFLKIFTN